MALSEQLEGVAERAAGHAEPGEELTGILVAEPDPGALVYLCAYEAAGGARSWLALDAAGEPLVARGLVREAASIAAICELAADTAGGGDLEGLRRELAAVRLRENPPGIDEAEEAALELERTVGAPPRLASARYLDDVGAAVRRLERALGDGDRSPFALAMQQGMPAVDALAEDVEANYKHALA
jgi:hypothetical protein